MSSSCIRPDLIACLRAERQRTAREMMTVFAKHEEMMRTAGFMPAPPPLEIVDHPDLLERAWGWDRIILTGFVNSDEYAVSQYKKYLQQYYTRNGGHNINGYGDNDLDVCIKMEHKLMSLLEQHQDLKLYIDEGSLSKKITNHVCQMTNANYTEFHTAAVALKCITKEAHMLCELIESKYVYIPIIATSSSIREFALRFMNFKGCDVAATAMMMAIMKEADLVLEFLEKQPICDDKGVLSWSRDLRNSTVRIMSKICPDTTGNAGKLVPDEPDGKNRFEKTTLQESREINQKIKSCSKEKGEECYLEEKKEANQNAKVEIPVKDGAVKVDSRTNWRKSVSVGTVQQLFSAEELEPQKGTGLLDSFVGGNHE